MPYERHVTVDGGKYTFFVPEGDWKIHVLRHGEPWLIIEQGSKAIWSLVAELVDAHELVRQIELWRSSRGLSADAALSRGLIAESRLIEAHDAFRKERGQEPFKP